MFDLKLSLSFLAGAYTTLLPFIATLGMMLVASGSAYILAEGQSINQVPDAFVWLGRGADLAGPCAQSN